MGYRKLGFSGLKPGGGGTPYIRMIGMIVVFFRGCNQQISISKGLFKQNNLKR